MRHLTLLLFSTMAACTTPGTPPPAAQSGSAAESTVPSEVAPPAVGPSAAHAPGSADATEPPPPEPAAPHEGPLAAFHDALRALERGEREDHVRILWLGDSHAQADFWTGGLRAALQKRFGNAGPGFVHLGMKSYRHDRVRLEVRGKWRMRPKQPSTIEPWADGAFGLGGILHAGYADHRMASIAVDDPDLAGKKLRWDVCYKRGLPEDRFRLQIGDEVDETYDATAATPPPIVHIEKESRAPRLSIEVLAGRPDFCGVAIETDPAEHPGVVLDNLGINGARYATALAWNEQAWAAEVRRRAPELFIFEYGGNEAGDSIVKPDQYERNARDLIARARRIRPEASCLVLAPADRADAEARIPQVLQAIRRAADASGCAFWNTYELMGGRGSLARWRDEKKAAPDGIHLTPKGYAELAALLTADLLATFSSAR